MYIGVDCPINPSVRLKYMVITLQSMTIAAETGAQSSKKNKLVLLSMLQKAFEFSLIRHTRDPRPEYSHMSTFCY